MIPCPLVPSTVVGEILIQIYRRRSLLILGVPSRFRQAELTLAEADLLVEAALLVDAALSVEVAPSVVKPSTDPRQELVQESKVVDPAVGGG